MLPNGDYPFIDRVYPLSELAFIEAPQALEDLLRDEAAANGITIIRDAPVELRCRYSGYPDATFLAFWPTGNERLNILAPKSMAPVRQA